MQKASTSCFKVFWKVWFPITFSPLEIDIQEKIPSCLNLEVGYVPCVIYPPPSKKWLFCSHLEKYLQHIACVVKAWYDSPYLNHFHVSTAKQGGYPRSQKWPIFAFHWNLSDHNTPLPECTNMQNKFFDKGSNYIKVLRLLSLVPRRRGSIQIKIKKTKL